MVSESFRRQWLWELAFHIKKLKGGPSRLRSYVKTTKG